MTGEFMRILFAGTAALALATASFAQEAEAPAPSPGEIVDAAPQGEWMTIDPEDLVVMTLPPLADGTQRKVVMQLIAEPFSQGWTQNIRTLARAQYWDGSAILRVQDNYVVQWGQPDPDMGVEPKPVPEGLNVMDEGDYTVDGDTLGEADGQADMESGETIPVITAAMEKTEELLSNPDVTEAERRAAIIELLEAAGLMSDSEMSESEKNAMISIATTQTGTAVNGWHERDSYAEWVEFWRGWPIANAETRIWFDKDDKPVEDPRLLMHEAYKQGYYSEVLESEFWPVHCYGMVGVGRNYSPDTGDGSQLYTVIGQAPRHLDRNIALVGRIIEGIEHLSSLPRGKGALGFYEDPAKRVPIVSVRMAADLPEVERPQFEYLRTESESFAKYADARANRRDPFFIVPAGRADICNIPVPVRRVTE